MNAHVLRRGGMGAAAALVLCLSAPALRATPAWADGSISSVNGAIHVENPSATDDLSTVNGSIHVDAGLHAGRVSTVNGGVHIGAGASVGRITTVNGGVDLEAHVAAQSLHTVNGAIHVGAGGRISGMVSTVNGALTLEDGADIAGDLANVNGRMSLVAAHVAGSIKTYSGDLYVGPGSRIDGGIHMYRPRPVIDWLGWFGLSPRRIPKVVIAPGAVVAGTLYFERPVELRVSRTARIGRVEGATPVFY